MYSWYHTYTSTEVVDKKRIGAAEENYQALFGRYAVVHKAWFLPLYYAGSSIAAAERPILHYYLGGKSYIWQDYRITGVASDLNLRTTTADKTIKGTYMHMMRTI